MHRVFCCKIKLAFGEMAFFANHEHFGAAESIPAVMNDALNRGGSAGRAGGHDVMQCQSSIAFFSQIDLKAFLSPGLGKRYVPELREA